MEFEKVLKGKIVTKKEVFDGYIGVAQGVIKEVSKSKIEGNTFEDHSDSIILPGAIDVHVHCFSNPNQGFEKTTRLAARGGVTTFLDMPYDLPNPINSLDALSEKIEDLNKHTFVDVGLWGTIPKHNGYTKIKELVEGGVSSFKLSTFETDEYRFPRIPNNEIIKAMEILSELDVLVAFHSEDDEIVKSMTEEFKEKNFTYNTAHAETRPAYTETSAVLTLCEFAYWTGAKLHIVHVSHPRTLELINIFKDMGTDVSAETCYTYLLFDINDLKENGPAAKMNPPLRTREEVEEMWNHLEAGNIDLISTDHIVWDKKDKSKGNDNIFNAPSGLPGLEIFVSIMFDAVVNKRQLSLNIFADLMATNAAERFQINNKGRIEKGYDADFVIVDPEKEWEMHQDTHETDIELLPLKNKKFKGKVISTYLRGEEIFDGVGVRSKAGYGHFLERIPSKE